MRRHTTLQLLRLEPERSRLHPALIAPLPADDRTFVATNMDEFRGEKLNHLVQHLLQKTDRIGIPDTNDVVLNSPDTARFVRESVRETRELRIGRECRAAVPWKLDLGNDRDMPRCGIGDNSRMSSLCRIGAVLDTVQIQKAVLMRVWSGTHQQSRKPRIRVDRDAPAPDPRKVPVKTFTVFRHPSRRSDRACQEWRALVR